jgi:hypothetical protein
MNIEAGKYYKTRDGRKAYVEHTSDPNPFQPKANEILLVRGYVDGLGSLSWRADGRFSTDSTRKESLDLVAEWLEPVKVSGWVNVYTNFLSRVYGTKKQADREKSCYRIACVYVEGTEAFSDGNFEIPKPKLPG